ncbi:DedA family protein [Nocardia sp. NPDC052566]|uniref:DedA family protein n=1 Tax=Nocardia sp. NPDC052566 TaxID=3364330 RepID=UPI0037CCA490
MNTIVELVGRVPAGAGYGVVAAVVLAESVLLVGAFVPTLTLMLTAGALARAGQLELFGVVGIAVVSVVAGDALGHRTGRVLGGRLRSHRLGRRIPEAAWRRTEEVMVRRGAQAVALGRFLPVIRTLTPHVAGASGLPYRRIAPYSAGAAVVWATAEAGAGYAATATARELIPFAGPALAAAVGVAGLIAYLVARLRRRTGTSVQLWMARPVAAIDEE